MSTVNTLDTFIAPKIILIEPGSRVERFEVGFDFPELDEENRQRLKFDIQEAGRITTPIFVKPSMYGGYTIIDGWSRYQISQELNMECHALLFEGLLPEQAQTMFLSQNLSRRQMSRNEKKQLAIDLKQRVSWSNAQIANLLGVNPSSVHRWFNPKTLHPVKKDIAKIKSCLENTQRGFDCYFQERGSLSPERRGKLINELVQILANVDEMGKQVQQLHDNLVADAIADAVKLEAVDFEASNLVAADLEPFDLKTEAVSSGSESDNPVVLTSTDEAALPTSPENEAVLARAEKAQPTKTHSAPPNMYAPGWGTGEFVSSPGAFVNSS